MPTTTDYLNELITQKTALAQAISNKGVDASTDEKFNTLVPKVSQIICNYSYDDTTKELVLLL